MLSYIFDDNSDTDDELLMQFQTNSQAFHDENTLPKRDVHSVLSPVFKELCAVLRNCTDPNDIIRIRSFMTKEISFAKKRYVQNNEPSGNLISCMPPACKRRKTHGCNYFARSV